MRKRNGLPEDEQRLAFSIPTFAATHDLGVKTIWEEIRAGRLKARKLGSRTIITDEDGAKWRQNLPLRQTQATVSDAE
jgi:hypothetical protein